MRGVIYTVAVCFCVFVASGCGPSQAVLEANQKANETACLKEIADLQADSNMLAPDWWRKGYSYTGTEWQAASKKAGEGGFVYNHLLWRMLALHLVLWGVFSTVVGANHHGYNGDEVGWITFIAGTLGLAAVWVVVWLLCSIIIPIFSPGSYLPFSFTGFLLTAGLWVTVIAFGGVLLIHYLARQATGGTVRWGTGGSSSTRDATRAGRVFRTMAKALFVSIATGIGGQLAGWLGGVLVFVITTGVCAIFEITPPPADE